MTRIVYESVRPDEMGPRGGIAGVLALGDRGPDPSMVESMMRSLAQRLGHAWAFYVDERVGFGVTRPSVTDWDHPAYPGANEDRSVRAVLDGTIDNASDVRRDLLTAGHRFQTESDAEIVAHAWEEYGQRSVDLCAGTFAWAVWDQARQQLFLARNHVGGRRLYWAVAENWLIFASDWRPIVMHPDLRRHQDVLGVPRSIVIDVNTVAAGLTRSDQVVGVACRTIADTRCSSSRRDREELWYREARGERID